MVGTRNLFDFSIALVAFCLIAIYIIDNDFKSATGIGQQQQQRKRNVGSVEASPIFTSNALDLDVDTNNQTFNHVFQVEEVNGFNSGQTSGINPLESIVKRSTEIHQANKNEEKSIVFDEDENDEEENEDEEEEEENDEDEDEEEEKDGGEEVNNKDGKVNSPNANGNAPQIPSNSVNKLANSGEQQPISLASNQQTIGQQLRQQAVQPSVATNQQQPPLPPTQNNNGPNVDPNDKPRVLKGWGIGAGSLFLG